MGEHLRIRGRTKMVPLQAVPQPFVILDHSVVDYRNSPALVQMRVGIFIRRRTVSGPSGMAQAKLSVHGFRGEEPGEAFFNFAFSFARDELMVADEGQPCAVIAAVFQSPQTLQNDGGRLLFADIADDAAHSLGMR